MKMSSKFDHVMMVITLLISKVEQKKVVQKMNFQYPKKNWK